MKTMLSFAKNNLGFMFVIFSTVLSIIGIIAGARAVKTDQYDDLLLIVVPLSNVCWFLFTIFAKDPRQKENTEEHQETDEITYSNKYTRLVPILAWVITIMVGSILLINLSMGIIITLEVYLTYFGHIY